MHARLNKYYRRSSIRCQLRLGGRKNTACSELGQDPDPCCPARVVPWSTFPVGQSHLLLPAPTVTGIH